MSFILIEEWNRSVSMKKIKELKENKKSNMHSIYSSPISHHTITHFVQVEPVFHVLFFILIFKVFHRLIICPHSKICNSLLKEFYSSELINNYFSLCVHQKKNQLCDPSNNASYNVSECLFFRVVTLLVIILTHSFST